MTTSSPTTPKPPQKKAILLIGPPGSRKTTLMLQFPSLYVIDCDMNLDGPEFHLRKSIKDLTYSFDTVCLNEGAPVDPSDCYDRTITLLKKIDPQFDWVGLDGLTSCNEYIIRKIMKEQKISYLEARNWSSFKTDAINLLFTKLRHINKNVIVTAHEVENVKANPKDMMNPILMGYEPFIQGAIREMLGGFFTDVWRLVTEPGPAGRVDSTLQCDKTAMMKQLKNSVGLSSEIKNPTYEVLHKMSGGLI
jgi:hypothetical protein